jgi:hypothetical protein
LGPWTEKFGRWAAAAARAPTACRKQPEKPLLQSPQNGVKGKWQNTRISTDVTGINALLEAETLTFLHMKTLKPALSLLRSHIQMC